MPDVIQKTGSSHTDDICEILLDNYTPVFVYPRSFLNQTAPDRKHRIANFLTRHVTQVPTDLQSHVLRIQLYQQQYDAESLYGALLDLFIVLQNKGRPLRVRLLQSSAKLLNPIHNTVLHKGISSPPQPSDKLPYVKASMFAGGVTGSTLLVKKIEARSGEYQDVVTEARDLIDCGQLQTARSLLEKYLLVTPTCLDSSKELLELYRHTRDRVAFENIWQHLKNLPLAAHAQWQALANDLQLTRH